MENANRSQQERPRMYVCICHGVTDHDIRRAAEAGVSSLAELTMRTGLGSGCGTCGEMAGELLAEARAVREFPLPVFAVAA
jgi:bacterioferritin-associated ferredoxin